MKLNGILGRSSLGTFELGKPYPARSGSTLEGSVSADGSATCTFDATTPIEGRFQADGTTPLVAWEASHDPGAIEFSFHAAGHSTCVFDGLVTVVGLFHADGICTVVWISGDGAVAITCLVNGTTVETHPFPTDLFDAPMSY